MCIVKELSCLKDFSGLKSNNCWPLFNRLIRPGLIEKILDDNGAKEERLRKLPAKVVTFLIISMGLFTEESIPQVFRAMIEGIRFVGGLKESPIPKKVPFARRDTALAQASWSVYFGRFASQ